MQPSMPCSGLASLNEMPTKQRRTKGKKNGGKWQWDRRGIRMYVKAPKLLNWFLKIFSPEPAENPGNAPTPTPEAPSQPSDTQVPQASRQTTSASVFTIDRT